MRRLNEAAEWFTKFSGKQATAVGDLAIILRHVNVSVKRRSLITLKQ
jgi:hypothetical protein